MRVEPYVVVPCCIRDVEYVLIMLNFTLAIDKSIVSDSTQAITFSEYRVHFLLKHIPTAGKSGWQPFSPIFVSWSTEGAQFAAFVIKFYLPESTAGVQDTKVGDSTDLGYHIIFGSHIVWRALDGFIEITGSRHRLIAPLGFLVTTVELTHGA